MVALTELTDTLEPGKTLAQQFNDLMVDMMMEDRLRLKGYSPKDRRAVVEALRQSGAYENAPAPLIVNGVAQEQPAPYLVREAA